MSYLNLAIFCYDFPHKKTQEGLFGLLASGFRPLVMIAAPSVQLTFPQSRVRVGLRGMHYAHPRELARRFNIYYQVMPHNSPECCAALHRQGTNLGVILGARILSQAVIDACKGRILNLHPGILPINRGLDNVKWALVRGLPQGATAHLIDRRVDVGRLVVQQEVPVYSDDTLVDIMLRVQNRELELLPRAIDEVRERSLEDFQELGLGTRFPCLPTEYDDDLALYLEAYRKTRGQP